MSIEDRFEANVDRHGEHHLWLGFIAADGTPQVRVDGRLTTARRVAWQLTHGLVPERATVRACPSSTACVRVDHLSLRASEVSSGGVGPTVDDLVERYLDFLTHKRGRQHSTVLRYRTVYARWLSPALGRLTVTALRSEHARRALNRMRRDGQSSSSIHQAFLVLNGACKFAVTNGELSANPMSDVRQPPGARSQPASPKHAGELTPLIDAAFAYDAEFGVACHLAAHTGMGRGELAGLRWPDVYDNRINVRLAINDAGGRVVIRDLADTTRARSIDVDESTVSVLADHRRRVDERASACGTTLVPDAYVFSHSPDGSEPIEPSYLTRRFREVMRRLGQARSDFDCTLHSWRP